MRTFSHSLFISCCVGSVFVSTACGRDALSSLAAGDGEAGAGITVRRTFFLPNDLPTRWAAYQDGAGPWIPVQPIDPKGREYELVLRDPSRQLGFALVGNLGPEHVEVVVSFLTVDDCSRGVDLGTSAPRDEPTSSGQISWSVAGLTAGEHAIVSVAGQSFETQAQAKGGSASAHWPPVGDVLATAGPSDGLPTRMIISRNLRLTDGMTIPALDFSGSEAMALQAGQLAIADAPGAGDTFTGIFLTTAGGSILVSDWHTGPATRLPFVFVPATKQAAGDLYEAMYVFDGAAGAISVSAFFRSAAGQTLVIPELPSGAKVWNAGAPGDLRPAAEWPATAPGAIRSASYTQGPDMMNVRWWQVTVSPSYDAQAVTVPDLRNVAGWDGAWDLSAGVATDWSVGTRVSSSQGATPEDGSREVTTTERGTLVP